MRSGDGVNSAPAAETFGVNFAEIERRYRKLLLEGIAPFWLERGIDWEHGGVLSCMTEDGTPVSTDKFLWSQARSVWTFAALYNRVEPRPEYLEAASNSVRFLLAHGRDARGHWVYKTDRCGRVLEGATSIYTDCFVIYGLNEYFRATGDEHMLAIARSTCDDVRQRIEEPGFSETAPYPLPNGWKNHGIPMIMTEVTRELLETTQDSALEQALDLYLDRIMHKFRRPQRKVILEFLDSDFREIPPPAGTFVMPGHAIESMWFVLRAAQRRGDTALMQQAAETMKWHLELGWDHEYGGLFLSRDLTGGIPYLPNGEMKIWWPHTEALYGTLLAYVLTRNPALLNWFKAVESWSWTHFPMPSGGEWYQRLTRTGQPSVEVVGLPVKDPFHLPRAAILLLQLAKAQMASGVIPSGQAS
jgi:N-acylglucosamine 2-epimerase